MTLKDVGDFVIRNEVQVLVESSNDLVPEIIKGFHNSNQMSQTSQVSRIAL